jgi:Protein of unknown function (DUF2867)
MSDAYRVVLDEVTIDATTAARRLFSRVPCWVRLLVGLRNRLVAPFGLKTSELSRSIGPLPKGPSDQTAARAWGPAQRKVNSLQ